LTITTFGLLAGLLLQAAAAGAGTGFDLGGLDPGKMTMRGHYDGVKTTASYTVTRERCDGKPCIHAVWDSEVKKIDMWLWPDARPIRTRYEKPREKTVVMIEYTPQGAVYRYTHKGETTTTRVRVPDLIETLSVDVIFFGFPFRNPKEIEFRGLDADSDDGEDYGFEVELDGVETLTIGGEKIKAYRLELDVTGVVGLFAPTFHFWYSFDPPHRYLKYAGPDEEFVITDGCLQVRDATP